MILPLASADEQAFIDALERALPDKSDQPGDERVVQLVSEMGLFSFALPADAAGEGASLAALGEAVRALANRLAPASLFAQTLACVLLANCGDGAQRVGDYLTGDRRLTTDVGHSLAAAAGVSRAMPVTAQDAGDHIVLNGTLPLVLNAHADADVLFTARGPDGRTLWVVLPLTHEGVTVEEFATVDRTRQFATVRLADVVVARSPAPAFGVLTGDSAQILLALATMLMCMDSVGVAQSSLDRTTEYVMQRTQFGQPVGLFQAVQHKAADMQIAVRSSHIAARSMLERLDHRECDLAGVLAVRGHVLTATSRAVETSIQLHGGIGFTWERGEHLRLRRCSVNEALLLDLTAGRDFVARDAFTQARKSEPDWEGK
jgi:alkylation response protein AidB-like acyl-CoA dehydrogenase